MQLLGDSYEIPEMTKLHGLLRPSRFAQRSVYSVDPFRRQLASFDSGWPAAAELLGHRWSMGDTSVDVFKVNAQIAPQANPHWGMQAGPRGLAHRGGLLASAHMRLVG